MICCVVGEIRLDSRTKPECQDATEQGYRRFPWGVSQRLLKRFCHCPRTMLGTVEIWILALGWLLRVVQGFENSSGLVIDIHGGIALLGEYYVNLGLGDASFRMQVDTGSSSLVLSTNSGYLSGVGVVCGSHLCGLNTGADYLCRGGRTNGTRCCAELAPEYCGFYLEYGGDTEYHVGSEGLLVQDELSLTGRKFGRVTLYRALRETGPWPRRVEGIWGLGLSRLNCNPTCSAPSYEVILGSLPKSELFGFGMCLGDVSGKLVFGSDGSQENLHQGEIEYLPMLSSSLFGTYYSVGLTGLKVGPQRIYSTGMAPPRQAIVDSGTTLLLLEDSLWQSLELFFKENLCRLPGVCSNENIFKAGVCLTSAPKEFPTLRFEFAGGLQLDLPPSLYFVKYEASVYCLGIQPAGGERTVLGDTFMRAYFTVFDLGKRRIGFAKPNRRLCGAVGDLIGAATALPNVKREPAYVTGISESVEAAQVAVAAIAGVAAVFGQLFVCVEISRTG